MSTISAHRQRLYIMGNWMKNGNVLCYTFHPLKKFLGFTFYGLSNSCKLFKAKERVLTVRIFFFGGGGSYNNGLTILVLLINT